MIVNKRRFLKIAKKWHQRASLKKKRISLQRAFATSGTSTAAADGCFGVYTALLFR
ncbi:hypothetical protein AALP_AA8G354300 [Arabis alpina]|uniref:Uncharacterized protein n=1 Tax=Arabis alpina TaxID=50452 RepID=A0A087GBH7_ARAAL|nr:hypothetical protein AALP_AA8G354300 [Arabis alpina]